MSGPALATPIPTAGQWRAHLRIARRVHRRRPLGEILNDLYILLWLFGVYGGVLVAAVRRHLATTSTVLPPDTQWIAIGTLFCAAGLVWHGLRLFGPVLASPAEQSWGVSTPVDRRTWLAPRTALLLIATALAGGVALLATAVLLRSDRVAWSLVAGVAGGVALAGGAVAAQCRPASRWPRLPTPALGGLGASIAAVVVLLHGTGRMPPITVRPAAPWLAVGLLAIAGVAAVAAVRSLGRLDRAAIGEGAQMASATASAAVALDPSLLTGVLEVRRWRRMGRVRSRPFRPRFGRVGVLLQAELRRQARRPGALLAWAALALAQHALALVAPTAAPYTRVVLAYIATVRLTSGLRTLARTPGLRRAIGGDERLLRGVHVVVPAVGAALWWLSTVGAGDGARLRLDAALLITVVAAAYRAATRPPMSYDGVAVETPFGMIPHDLIMQIVRGPDLLGAAILLRMLASG
jgi:hypothetical protein